MFPCIKFHFKLDPKKKTRYWVCDFEELSVSQVFNLFLNDCVYGYISKVEIEEVLSLGKPEVDAKIRLLSNSGCIKVHEVAEDMKNLYINKDR